MTQYIKDPIKIKILLSKSPSLETLLENLLIELQVVFKQGTGIIGTPGEIMEAMAIGSNPLSDMPPTAPDPGAKMTNIVASYQKMINAEYGLLLTGIQDDVFTIEKVLEKIHNAIKRLPIEQKEVIDLKYWHGRTWKQMQDVLRLGRRQVEGYLRDGVEEICRVIEINLDSYDYCLERLEVEEQKNKAN